MTSPLNRNNVDSVKVTKPSRGRPVGDHDKKKLELLDIAINLLVDDGYPGLSMRKLANNAAATTGTITYYFANKCELMESIADELFARFTQLLSNNNDSDVKRVIEDWISWTYDDKGHFWKAFLQLQSYAKENESFIHYVYKRYDVFTEQLNSFIKQGQESGQLRNDIPSDILAEQLSAMADGFMMTESICPRRLSAEKVEQLKHGLVTLISA